METVQKPWGSFTDLHNGDEHIKIIEVKAGARLSLQSHEKREEYWYVLDGTIIVTTGRHENNLKYKILNRGESCNIGLREIHRMQSFNGPAKVLEVSSGEFDEEDITRYEDDYGRKGTTTI